MIEQIFEVKVIIRSFSATALNPEDVAQQVKDAVKDVLWYNITKTTAEEVYKQVK